MINNKKHIAYWLLLGVAMLMIQVILGGITRLTGSGLSITEWKPLLGALPPMNETEWQALFEQYKKIAQFKILNQDFAMADFKFIYFWEWFHRNWARFIGVAFLVPFIYFLWKKMITKEMVPKLLGLFALGIAQGLIGWIMVASGLNDENIYVNHIKLSIHFISALILIAFTYWFALSLMVKSDDRVHHPHLQNLTFGILGLLGLQLVYGAFMAGLKAGSFAPTWPSINGDMIPSQLWQQSFLHHPINIHFVHRMLAYLLTILVLLWYVKARKIKTSELFKKFIHVPVFFVVLQIVLGIFTVLHSIHTTRNGFGQFELLALSHQIVAMCLAMSLVWVLFMQQNRHNTK